MWGVKNFCRDGQSYQEKDMKIRVNEFKVIMQKSYRKLLYQKSVKNLSKKTIKYRKENIRDIHNWIILFLEVLSY